MPIRVPIQFLNDQGNIVPRAHEGRPVARVHFFTPSGSVDVQATPAWALIDTGADLNYADEAFISQMRWPIERETTVTGATSAVLGTLHTAGVLLGPLQDAVGLHTQAVSLPTLHDRTKLYQVILGNLFLEKGCLHMDYHRGEFWLDYYTDAARL